MKIALASESPQRQKLFSYLNLPFVSLPAKIDETITGTTDPVLFSKKMAILKAETVARRKRDYSVIGADTVVAFDGKIVGKPKNLTEAFETLCLLNGKKHRIVTSIMVINHEKRHVTTGHKITEMEFKEVSNQQILDYIKSGEPMGKAGAYAIQGMGRFLVKKIKGCYNNVVGFPLCLMTELLQKTGIGTEFDWSHAVSRCCRTPFRTL